MKTLPNIGGISALVCAGTYILALGLLATVLTPMADGSLALTSSSHFSCLTRL
jgi:hypothetical protein